MFTIKTHYIQLFDLRLIQSLNLLSLNTVDAMEHLCNSAPQNFTQCISLFQTLKGLSRQFITSKYSLYLKQPPPPKKKTHYIQIFDVRSRHTIPSLDTVPTDGS